MLLQAIHAQIKGNRVKAAAMDDARARGFCGGRMLTNRLVHPAGLTRQIDVVRALFCALFDQLLSVELVGTNGGDDHFTV